ncbi:alanine racemase [Allopusillimonas soli]|uniref:Alanine racemase n=1 Tax=Allopusillimonas soli TaxID=659016 RepID=A0A853FFJ5_9BURK|nr:alanine racemase [Allopusillimonas soli]NYT38452.1 alanine racemase [Allopusillimonas soli]TEA71993.1 alanine racemase [Allopusillimonas soli]
MPRPISATIRPASLSHNLKVVQSQLQARQGMQPRVWAVIKARAYGHGIESAVSAFAGADGLAMLDLEEAVQCRELGWAGPILLLEGHFQAADVAVLDEYRLHTTIHCSEQLEMLERGAHPRRPIDAFIKLDTGMSRLGFTPASYRSAFERALRAQQAGILGRLGKMTHFARADDDADVTQAQLDVFNQITQGLPGPISVCNSAGTLTPGLWAKAGAAAGTDSGGGPTREDKTPMAARASHWVRPGICLYGASPFAQRSAHALGLRPAMTLSASLISVRDIPAGTGVGYGHIFHAPAPMRIGVVACGYADGYPRHAVSGTPITVDGVRTVTVGRVSMDMLAVDLDAVPQARVGSTVVLWGEGGPSVDEVAAAAGTIGYELLCAVAPRVPRTIISTEDTQ